VSSFDEVNDGAAIEDVLVQEEPALWRDGIGIANAELGELPSNLWVIAPRVCAFLYAVNPLIQLWREDF
jgi:hypothetical protein